MALRELPSKNKADNTSAKNGAANGGRLAWREDKARATLIREAAGSMQSGKTPRPFAELLFDDTNIEDLAPAAA